jgi:hypothetical protein
MCHPPPSGIFTHTSECLGVGKWSSGTQNIAMTWYLVRYKANGRISLQLAPAACTLIRDGVGRYSCWRELSELGNAAVAYTGTLLRPGILLNMKLMLGFRSN